MTFEKDGGNAGSTSGSDAKNFTFGVVVSRFNPDITKALEQEALDCLRQSGAEDNNIDLIRVPGAFEIPVAANLLLRRKLYDSVIALGCLIRGGTPHFDLIARSVADALQRVALEHNRPIANGVLATNNKKQALRRSLGKPFNRGREVALAAIEMASLFRGWAKTEKQT